MKEKYQSLWDRWPKRSGDLREKEKTIVHLIKIFVAILIGLLLCLLIPWLLMKLIFFIQR